ncbi:hypothetical protein KSF_007440 [Reticulibacter mediterranei]|uniref:Uncharacterized protein n=1 Tax=Reticulibacter mediterranei TaxID=2778369 RepID=A0A8J3IJB9_9CHLR|nr:hypothetical protein [Reticulibacter mediterranei]GHO90696.1 hypothetical protein KSF_007440 [Reticulibacter mediterranei]
MPDKNTTCPNHDNTPIIIGPGNSSHTADITISRLLSAITIQQEHTIADSVKAIAVTVQENMVDVDHMVPDIVDFVQKSEDLHWQNPTRAFDMMYPQTSCDGLPLSKLNKQGLLDERLLA